jgi:outer membrane biosynthesis protein TonB
MDKMLSGHSGDYDRNGDVIKSSSGSTIPIPNLTGSTEAASGVRRSIFGSKNGDVDLNLYIAGWRQKIENTGRLNYSQSAKDKVFNDPIVVVSIRSDGSIENILILRSSGRKEIDDAVRRIVNVNAPFSAFPPSLARRYDVIDIRQVWTFDQLLHINDEFR